MATKKKKKKRACKFDILFPDGMISRGLYKTFDRRLIYLFKLPKLFGCNSIGLLDHRDSCISYFCISW